jgi:hypothetical protein
MRAVLTLALVLAAGCDDVPTDETPRGALTMFLAAMDRSERDPDALQEAYALLSSSTRRELAARARAVGNERLEPWDMLVRGRFRMTFTPRAGSRGMRERIRGSRATVIVTDQDERRRAEVPLVKEDGRWRVVLELPSYRAGESRGSRRASSRLRRRGRVRRGARPRPG